MNLNPDDGEDNDSSEEICSTLLKQLSNTIEGLPMEFYTLCHEW